ncbi:MAG: histidine kinase N-terminal 7TM domain-containing protein [Anaerolineae bacterium]|nr:histidine kinase N-terminal 7TM domain-containing protein [Anaerolineae bacterium]
MEYRATIYALLHIPALIVTLAAIPFIWSRRNVPGLVYLVWMEIAGAAWIAAAGLEMAAATVPLKFFWSAVCYLGTLTVPVFLLLFAVEYAQPHNHWGWRRIVPLFIVPVLTWIVVFTEDLRPLNWPSLSVDPQTNIGVYGHGPWFWVAVTYIYGLVVAALVVLSARLIRLRAYFRRQIAIFALAAVFPILGNLLYLTGLNPIRGMEWTPISFGLMSVVLGWGALQGAAFKLVPVAHERLLDSMAESVLVLDSQGCVADLNLAAERAFGRACRDVVGKPAQEVLGASDAVNGLLQSDEEQRLELSLTGGEAPRVFATRISPLRDRRGRLTGRLLVLHDVTGYKRLEQEREELIQGLQEALAQVKTLRGLLPICANCKRIRDDQGYWHSVESYISEHSDVDFSHGICPDCARKLYPELYGEETDSEQED